MRHKDLRTFLFFMFDIQNLLKNTEFTFNIICLTETWCSNSETVNKSYLTEGLFNLNFRNFRDYLEKQPFKFQIIQRDHQYH